MKKLIIAKHYGPAYIQTGAMALITVLLLIVMRSILAAFNDIVHVDLTREIMAIRLIALGVGLAAVCASWYFATNKSYELDHNSLTTIDTSIFGGKKKSSASLTGMSTVNVRQSSLGKLQNYGAVIITLDALHNGQQYVLSNIQSPHEVAEELRSWL